MKAKRLHQLQIGDYIKVKKTGEYFAITSLHTFPALSSLHVNYTELAWVYVPGFGKVHTKALKKIFQLDTESRVFILTFKKVGNHYE